MAVTNLNDIIEPAQFTNYVVENTMEQTALVQSGVATRNATIVDQLRAGAHSFTTPFWRDLENTEADIASDDPEQYSTPSKIGAGKQITRKSFLHGSWSAMNLASEIAGDNALDRIQSRTTAYWNRQLQRRLISALNGIRAANEANDDGDMVLDISGATGDAAVFSAKSVIRAAHTMGDAMSSISALAVHSDIYKQALENDLIEFVRDSQGNLVMPTFRGLAVIMDDGLTVDTGAYTSILFGNGAIGYGTAEPRIAAGTEIENNPSAGNGGGQEILHSRMNTAMHPAGFSWIEGTVGGESPTIAEMGEASHWQRVIERKSVPLAFLVSKVAA
ncbi:major capsid protein [Salinisphaera orenii]|uniref:Phage coat protein n=1 Tax=Salinisphaera orenii YIM 95161 TaxID=1051139 RepID=A0A423PDZ2_9GAMM|nr:major capsid protein [Salinisphaera halophila]ROO23776.1 phage coat protein [Salinisphaera halophila YIM 95161]